MVMRPLIGRSPDVSTLRVYWQETTSEGGERDESGGIRHEHPHQEGHGLQQHRGVDRQEVTSPRRLTPSQNTTHLTQNAAGSPGAVSQVTPPSELGQPRNQAVKAGGTTDDSPPDGVGRGAAA